MLLNLYMKLKFFFLDVLHIREIDLQVRHARQKCCCKCAKNRPKSGTIANRNPLFGRAFANGVHFTILAWHVVVVFVVCIVEAIDLRAVAAHAAGKAREN